MHPADIKARLEKKGITQEQIAEELGVTGKAVSNVVRKTGISDRIMKAIAAAIGKDHRKVFPEYYQKPPKRRPSGLSKGSQV